MTGAFLLLCLAALSMASPAPPRAGREVVLKHDDGRQDLKKSYGGGGHAVRFERPAPDFVVTGVSLYGSRYGAGYDPLLEAATITVCNQDMIPLAAADAASSRRPRGGRTSSTDSVTSWDTC